MTKLASRLRCSLVLFATGCAAVPPNRPSNDVRDVIAVDAAHDDDDLSFWDVPYREKAFIDFDPAERNDGLLVGGLGVDGGKREVIAELAAEIAQGQHGSYDSLLIAHRSRLLFESYYLRGRINMTHPQVSVTKAYTALTVGRAIQLGLLTIADLKRPLISFLGELDPKRLVRGAEKITLHQAMTMRSGIRIDTKQAHRRLKASLQTLVSGLNLSVPPLSE